MRRLLGDTVGRDYARKLELFNAFAAPELRQAVALAGLERGMRVLDAGCGGGGALPWLYEAVGHTGSAVGLDLARAHIDAARRNLPPQIELVQGDLMTAVPAGPGFDVIWSVNTLHHLEDPCAGLRRLRDLLRTRGRIVVGQSGLLPEMFFAWDARLERLVNGAVRRYYLDRYGLSERDLTGVRGLVGWVRRAGYRDLTCRTLMIERLAPLSPASRAYLGEAILRDTWGERLRPYLAAADFAELAACCDPADERFALDRDDFHYLQTFTVVTAAAGANSA